jgi:hypothetical protein
LWGHCGHDEHLLPCPVLPPFIVALRKRGPTAIHDRRPRSERGSDRFPDSKITFLTVGSCVKGLVQHRPTGRSDRRQKISWRLKAAATLCAGAASGWKGRQIDTAKTKSAWTKTRYLTGITSETETRCERNSTLEKSDLASGKMNLARRRRR